MSIEVSCECGKRFNVGDQFAGKRGRCKACGRTVTVPAAAEPLAAEPPAFPHELADESASHAKAAAPTEAASARGPAVPAYPSLNRRGRAASEKSARFSIHVNPVIVVLVLVAIAIPTGIFVVEQGPVKARDELAKIEPTAEGNITSQISRAIQHEYAGFAFNDDPVGISRHKALNVVFDDPVVMIHLPDSLQIQGRTTEGNYHGEFHPRTMRFDAEVPILGQKHKLEGSVTDEDQSLYLDGNKIN